MSEMHAETVGYVRDTMLPEQDPPATSVGAIGWLRENLFSGWFNSVLTILSLIFIYWILSALLPWFFSPTWEATSLNECREILAEMGREGHFGGACWATLDHPSGAQRHLSFPPPPFPAPEARCAGAAKPP